MWLCMLVIGRVVCAGRCLAVEMCADKLCPMVSISFRSHLSKWPSGRVVTVAEWSKALTVFKMCAGHLRFSHGMLREAVHVVHCARGALVVLKAVTQHMRTIINDGATTIWYMQTFGNMQTCSPSRPTYGPRRPTSSVQQYVIKANTAKHRSEYNLRVINTSRI